jgi:hypothetical protein
MMVLDLLFWAFLIVLLAFALDLAIQVTAAIAQGLASILKEPFAQPGNANCLAPHSWSRLSSR